MTPTNPQPAPAQARPGIINAFTVDVEDYFQVAAFAHRIDPAQWDALPCRVERNVERILALLADAGVKGTFFTLGWIAQRHPQVVRAIVGQGHELASHGYAHQRASEQSEAELRDDLVRARKLLEDIAGEPVIGYRAPSFSIGRDNLWAHRVLAETGHRYSSSIYPVRHDHYGMPEAPRFAHRTPEGLTEIPASTVRVGQVNLPSSGGGYFRLLPYRVSRWSVGRINRRDREPAVFYCHPWEVDPEQPRVPGVGAKARFRHYVNLSRTAGRIERLLRDFRWDRMDRVFAGEIGLADGGHVDARVHDHVA